MTTTRKRIFIHSVPGSPPKPIIMTEPYETIFISPRHVLRTSSMHSARVWLPDPLREHGGVVDAMMYHQPNRNGCPPNAWGTSLLRQADTVKFNGMNRTTAYGDVWLDVGSQDVAVFEDITSKVDFHDPDEATMFASQYAMWFPKRRFQFHINERGTIDFCVFSPHQISEKTLTLARMHWG
jgi:hypothetical protein